ncbi:MULTISPECIES: hypothetical protein [Thermomonosporaceae]|uniref:hypothetical protein n=1 Tax=Thermomonosporaceae TaxID=2012 RepID=UPI00255AE366|nr:MULTISPECIES: hypothetical protein [Thermomonosporaceae]MDL4773598.1 hypothetical protein [Actinomadura xylanilytica]
MSETPNDPAGSTTQFQYFAQQGQPEKSSGPNMGLIIGVVAVVVVVAILAVAFMML